MTRRKVDVECLFCGEVFTSVLRWEGVPEKDYCSKECERSDSDMSPGFEKFEKSVRGSEW